MARRGVADPGACRVRQEKLSQDARPVSRECGSVVAGNVIFNPVYAGHDFIHRRIYVQRRQVRLDDLDLRLHFIVCSRE